ncbi:putative resistance protein (transport) [Escherichia coli]|nr:putative resistance protein (transport) [Escherichia coli]
MFCFSLYGYILDLNPGIIGYKIVFGIMACFAFSGAVVSVMLVKRISQRKKEMLAAEA